jgi:hypothetical protein
MSNRYKGAIISATPPTTTGGESGVASGAWTLEQQMQLQAAGLWPSPYIPKYIEDVFSTWLYTGTGSTQTITNGIDLSTYGGLIWAKNRSGVATHHQCDTVRGVTRPLHSETTAGQGSEPQQITGVTTSGFTLGTDGASNSPNFNGSTFASWTFREQAKFFDIVTYTGTGANRTVAHNLGSVPGCIIVKKLDAASNWTVYHRSLTSNSYALRLNTTDAEAASINFWNNTTPTSTQFTVGVDAGVNSSGSTFVAYIFAHDAGGFGLTGTDNVISCGSYVGTGAVGNAVTLGYEPQWLMVKNITSAFDWIMYDNMRGMPASATNTGDTKFLRPNTSAAEAGGGTIIPTATGFQANTTYQGANFSGETYIYIAIRRGPMAVPTDGTKVFTPATYTGTGVAATITSAGFPVDLVIGNSRNAPSYGSTGAFGDRLRGKQNLLYSPSTGAEDTTNVSITGFDVQNGISVGGATAYSFNFATGSYVNWFLRRAPSYFDEVCYTGTGSAQALTHNLAAVPELMIVKTRSGTSQWGVYSSFTGNAQWTQLNLTDAASSASASIWNLTNPTSTNFSVGTGFSNVSATYVAYLFATCAGVSKVGSYTGTGTTQTINCGFTGGSRFVMIKRTDSTGDWYVWDSARGIIPSNDPYLLLNSTAAEVTGTDYIDTAATGFEISSTAPAAINASGGTFIFLAIA